jgi:hypothetical protein
MLGDGGWMQRANIVGGGAMTIAAAIGSAALADTTDGRAIGRFVLVYGAALPSGPGRVVVRRRRLQTLRTSRRSGSGWGTHRGSCQLVPCARQP